MRYLASIDVPRSIGDAFDYLARFSHAAKWDPSVVEATQLTPDPVGVGSQFRLVATFMGNKVPLSYEIVEYDRPNRVVFEAHTSTVHSRDAVTFESTADGTRITYDASLDFKGLFKLLTPVIARAFNKIGDAATNGLKAALSTPPSQA